MAKIVFSSDDLPPGLAGAERYALWRGIFHDAIGGVDVGASQAPFEGHATFGIFNDVVIGDLRGTLNSSRQSARAAPASAGGRLALMVNLGAGNIRSVHRGRDEALAAQGAMLVSRGADGVMNSIEDYNAWCLIDLPDRALARAVPRAEDMLGCP